MAAAVILDQRKIPRDLRQGLDDSKKLTADKRGQLFALLHSCGAARIGVGVAEVHEIDSFNILNATYRAMERAVAALSCVVHVALVDGNRAPKLACEVKTIVEGDGKSLSIAAASIVAKVTRDRLMLQLAAAHPGYGWHTNMGYGTAAHCAAIERLGLTPHHRRSFAPVRARMAATQIDLI